MIKGDRVVIQQDIQGINYNDVGTIASSTIGNEMVVRFRDQYVSVHKTALRLAEKEEFEKQDSQDLVNPMLINGSLYSLIAENTIKGLKLGDVGIVVGVTIKANEDDDLFIFDFGFDKFKFDKKFIDAHMNFYNYDFEQLLINNEIDDGSNEDVNKVFKREDIYRERIEKYEETLAEEKKDELGLKSLQLGDYVFDLSKKGVVSFSGEIKVEEIDLYIQSLNKLKTFLTFQ